MSENRPGWKGSSKIIWSKLSGEGDSWWDFLAAWSHLETSNDEDSMFLGRLLQWILHLTVIFSHVKMKHLPLYSSHLVISMWILMEREPPSSLWLSFKYWNSVTSSHLSLPFSREKIPTPSAFPHQAGSPDLWSPLRAFFGTLHSVYIFLGL